jgi:hypothetical protein
MTAVQQFAQLHRGGRIALSAPDSGEFRPAKTPDGDPLAADGPDYHRAIAVHLHGAQPIGVYPLTTRDTVFWCGADFDVGDHDSLIHAANMATVLRRFNITAWTELSRSKGAHTLVYLQSELPAVTARTAMLAAAQIVDADNKEIYPKQVSTHGGYGNGLRLAYPKRRPLGRQVMVDSELQHIVLRDFCEQAMDTRASADDMAELADKYVPPTHTAPLPPPVRVTKSRLMDDYGGRAKEIWNSGPRPDQDRSSMLVAFAGSLLRQQFSATDVEMMVAECDLRWGAKYTKRPDGAQRVRELVASAAASNAQRSLLGDEEPF